MEVIFMGTGTSHGVPMIGCDCAVCKSENPKNKRTRTSVHIIIAGAHIQVDASPEFRLQCLANDVKEIDMVILTHGHADHVAGLDDMRRFVDFNDGEGLPVYAFEDTQDRLRNMYPYAVRDRPEFRGYPAFIPHLVEPFQNFEFEWGKLETTVLPHGRFDVMGLVFTEAGTGQKFTYYTDCKEVGEEQTEMAKGSDLVVLDGLRYSMHPTHMCVDEATEAASRIGAPLTYFTHMTHEIDHDVSESKLPKGVRFAYDGLRLEL